MKITRKEFLKKPEEYLDIALEEDIFILDQDQKLVQSISPASLVDQILLEIEELGIDPSTVDTDDIKADKYESSN